MIAIVDREACIGCGLCESICPEVFELDGENIAVVLTDVIPLELEDSAIEAQDECPVAAIIVE